VPTISFIVLKQGLRRNNYRIIASSDPKYLSATDILIGDMSDLNYEFLLFNRPIILLANDWLRKNFPDLGIKTNLEGLDDAIKRSISFPMEYENQRKYWLNQTHNKPNGTSTKRVINKIIQKSKINDPIIYLADGGSEILKSNLNPFVRELKLMRIKGGYWKNQLIKEDQKQRIIWISPHNKILKGLPVGYKVHIDHGLKGEGVNDFQVQIEQYKNDNYYPDTDLHITEGIISTKRSKKLLGVNGNRVSMVGYPKADDFLRYNTVENKISVCEEFGFDINKPIITYAPAGKYKYPEKQGATLSKEVLMHLKNQARKNEGKFNILVKMKNRQTTIISRISNKLKRIFKSKY